ncbi:ATP-grasp domain-containing protein [Quadrisphaera sp. KR29]|uniref:ATP-grasp domain-containing protein n=1 Tax=Quadrisphaera sp. KR29 TaxID=3461391 RepID=UPI0040442C83
MDSSSTVTAPSPPATGTGTRAASGPGAGTGRVGLVTCAEVPDLDPEGRLLLGALRDRGLDARPVTWDDDGADWAALDLAVVRSTWDYATRRAEFLAWAARAAAATQLLNPLPLLDWSTDKHYLADLQAAGLPVVPSAFVEVGGGEEHPYLGVEHVVKPAVSAGSRDTLRLGAHEADRSRAHLRAVHASGRCALVQPYLSAVDEVGETALVFLDGQLSHAMRKAALLPPSGGLVEGLFAPEEMSPREPSAAEVELARAVVEQAVVRAREAGAPRPLYARVDLLPGDHGEPLVLELELVEPSLFLDHAPGAVDRLADAVVGRLGR